MDAHPVALATLLSACAPNIGPRTMTAIVRVESDGNPLSIHDNSANVSFAPVDLVEAIAWSKTLLAQRHSIDLGLAQINSANLPRLGMSLREAFDPCTNLRGGATILSSDYRSAVYQFGAGQYALRRAIGAYNTGSLFAGFGYVSKILRAAGIRAEDDFLVPDLASMSPSIPSPYDVPVGARAGSSSAGAGSSRTIAVPRRVVVRRVSSPGATADAAAVPLRAPILVTVGGVNAISPTVVGAPRGAGASSSGGAGSSGGHQGPVVLRLDTTTSGRPFSSPFDSPIGISRDGLPTGTGPIIAIPSPPAAVPVTGAGTGTAPAPAAAATAAPAAAASAAPAAK
jgi:type IV secretion system protein VirB1